MESELHSPTGGRAAKIGKFAFGYKKTEQHNRQMSRQQELFDEQRVLLSEQVELLQKTADRQERTIERLKRETS